jgi:site-specific DNA recombinase
MPSTNGHGSKPERVALYLRVSSEEQRDRETIEIQREFLEQYRSLYELEVAEKYEDDGASGTVPLHERPEGRRLLEDAREGKFQVVLVYKLDRLGRSLLIIVDAHDRLQQAGVALRSATEPIDTSTPSGRLIFQMLASFAEYERGTIRERTQAGQRRAFKNGRQVGAIPYGYDIVAKDGAFVVVEEEAGIVREIIANIAAGATLYSEAKRLNDEDVPSPGNRYRGKPRKHGGGWGHTTIREIVQQRAYAGTHIVKLNGGAEIIERAVPPIVEPALREKALECLRENKRYAGGRRKRNYLLSGLIECVTCGWTYVGNATSHSKGAKRNYQYRCGTRVRVHDPRYRGNSCPYINAEWLESLVWQDVRGFLQNPGEVLERVREQLEGGERAEALEERLASLQKRLAAKHSERERAMRLYTRGLASEEETEVLLADLKNQADNLRLLISATEAELSTVEEDRLVARNTEAWLLTLRKNLAEVEQDTDEAFRKRRELVKLLIEKIGAGRDEDGRLRVDISYRFSPPGPSFSSDGLDGVRDFLRSRQTLRPTRTKK